MIFSPLGIIILSKYAGCLVLRLGCTRLPRIPPPPERRLAIYRVLARAARLRPDAAKAANRFGPYFARPIEAAIAPGFFTPFRRPILAAKAEKRLPDPSFGFRAMSHPPARRTSPRRLTFAASEPLPPPDLRRLEKNVARFAAAWATAFVP